MDNRVLTETGEAITLEEARITPPFVRWVLMGALATLPFHALLLAIIWIF